MAASPCPAFDLLEPACPEYAALPIADAFGWGACASPSDHGEWYLVCFRSIRRPEADEALLTALDDRAHEEARSAPGFVHYLKGPVNERGECLSFCIWESRLAARAASGGPRHALAASIANDTYSSWTLELYRLVKRRGAAGFRFELWRPTVSAVAGS